MQRHKLAELATIGHGIKQFNSPNGDGFREWMECVDCTQTTLDRVIKE